MNLDKNTIRALVRFKEAKRQGQPWGERCMVSMQRAEDAGLVKRIERNGLIADWELTPAGDAWAPPT